ncbi:formate dehydrogenase accessory sulfurtransferase FdhD [Pinisolibacter aquiterrae]|uniref:formate dehydrogenase accessory sulfurtransferase FdhD n=1 Tax=Pinisolibacter aquiterrae TaxID=2815579 RepID=UPI001C3DA19B|nr:formate dehydrogenase accessory sulfurtransferase FdhD [Pinisolibacter aquiterrae]MBV5263136.1 formate dehydrogenase accessory sulfurtransferase FdhD [Pinisolibacter aquiterrae]MCC8234050.1 formate dehydrogenase accessory sulfurtransferase FdhD [Pinisolibacter aquiterrae]
MEARPGESCVTVAAGASERPARRHRLGAEVAELRESVAEELPIALVYNGHAFAVMMATPADLEDFARGFSLTEGVVDRLDEIEAIAVAEVPRGREARVTIAEPRALALRARTRALAGRTGCGLCGVDSIAEAMRPVARPLSPARFEPEAIRAAVAAFPAGQPLNAVTGATHAAALADAFGRVLLTREDVGRHNAVDKLVGALALTAIDPGAGFVVVSSRCSYEMIHKTAAAGIPLIVSVSAPTGLAVDLAERLGVGLAAFARDGRFTVYAGEARFV